jgi:hypothetical protein
VQAAVSEFFERDAVMLGDIGDPYVQLVGVVLIAEIESWARLRQGSEPILAEYVSGVFSELDNRFASPALA